MNRILLFSSNILDIEMVKLELKKKTVKKRHIFKIYINTFQYSL